MRISINLASQPYVELRPVYSRLRTWMAILALLGVALWFLYRGEHREAEASMERVAAVQNHVQQLETEQARYQALMRQPANAAILTQSDFLNGLFRAKAFSWTATMEDLENVLPAGVQVTAIDPIVAPNGHVTIRLRVTGARDRALDLIRNLEQSKHFAAPRLAAETLANTGTGPGNAAQPVSDTNQVNFDILADYRPLALPVKDEKADEDQATAATAAEKKAEHREGGPPRTGRHRREVKPGVGVPAHGGPRP